MLTKLRALLDRLRGRDVLVRADEGIVIYPVDGGWQCRWYGIDEGEATELLIAIAAGLSEQDAGERVH